MKKKYNNQTGGYKINLIYKGKYLASTDFHKTCKAAKTRALQVFTELEPAELKAVFSYPNN